MKSILLLNLFLSLTFYLSAQNTLTGIVTDSTTSQALPGANIAIEGTQNITTTGSDGSFRLIVADKQYVTLVISYIGYTTLKVSLNEPFSVPLSIQLTPHTYMTGLVTVNSTRLSKATPMSSTDLSSVDIQKMNVGKDLPSIIENTPSVVTTSDAGNGIGYTGIRIRGSDPTRINVTVNGIPINDAESQGMYWVDMPDLASSIEDIQIQRGVGTSTNGAGAFGGSVNIRTSDPSDQSHAEVSNAYGSFNTLMNNVIAGTGSINDHWKFETRLSRIKSDGYVDRAASDLKSLYFTGGYFGEKDILKAVILSGKEETYQSWWGVPEAALDTNRTWNYYTYENQVDNYQQDHYQLFYGRKINSELSLNTAVHYTYGRGYYEEYQEQDDLANYLLEYPVIGNDTIIYSDVIRRKWLKNDFYGFIASLTYKPSINTEMIIGAAWNEYSGDHFGEVIWAQFASTSTKDQKYYDNNGLKNDVNGFIKINKRVSDKISVYGDIQMRNVRYRFTGIDDNGKELPDNDNLQFFNPKAGITFNITNQSNIYFFAGIGNKEPSRDDYTESTLNSRPKHEQLYNAELGYNLTGSKLKTQLNLYYMYYKDQLVLTGKVNDVGNYTRTNIDRSYRAGIELSAGYILNKWFHVNGSLTLSDNRIRRFEEYIDDYDNGGQLLYVHNNTRIAFSPDVIGMLGVTVMPLKDLEISFINKYVGDQYLDNTTNNSKRINAYNTVSAVINYTLELSFMKNIGFTFMVNNLFDAQYESNGYTFSYIYGSELTIENYYYPQAGINYMLKASLRF